MKVKKLIKELQKLDQELEVVISSDAEGNGYSLYDGLHDGALYDKETREIYESDDMDHPKSAKPCVILFPE